MTGNPVRFNWEKAVQEDRELQRIDAFVKMTLSKFPQPPARADAGRGSRYESAPPHVVKAERPVTMVALADGMRNGTSSTSDGYTPEFIDYHDYQAESSSDLDTREVNPMDELSDFESETSQQVEVTQHLEQVQEEEQEIDQSMDVEMEGEDAEHTTCEVCKSSEREDYIILCDDCNAEYHTFCLNPLLPEVPEGTWYCPKCKVKHSSTAVSPAAETLITVKNEQLQTITVSGGPGEDATATQRTESATGNGETVPATTDANGAAPPINNACNCGAGDNDPTSIPIGQALEGDPQKSNLLLVHACNCDDVKCSDPEFHVLCSHMKRFLRSVCWASHSDKWRSYRLARITAELFAYHAMNCELPQCNVPLCVRIREEEIV